MTTLFLITHSPRHRSNTLTNQFRTFSQMKGMANLHSRSLNSPTNISMHPSIPSWLSGFAVFHKPLGPLVATFTPFSQYRGSRSLSQVVLVPFITPSLTPPMKARLIETSTNQWIIVSFIKTLLPLSSLSPAFKVNSFSLSCHLV